MARPRLAGPLRRWAGRWARGALAVALLLAGTAATAQTTDATLTSSERFPLRGQPTRLVVTRGGAPLPGVEIEALYRPNSETSSSETLPPTDAAGAVPWTPRDAGIVTLTARVPGEASPVVTLNVAVRHGRFPIGGLGIMILAGVLLFGGVILGFTRLLREPGALPPGEPPST